MTKTDATEELIELEVRFTRIIDAPRDLVFKVWTEAEHLQKWWGPKGMTNPVCEFDPRPGGSLYIVMRAEDGSEYPMGGTVDEIEPPKKLVFRNHALAPDGSRYLDGHTTVTFEDHVGGKTKLMVVSSAKALVPIANQMVCGMEEGWSMTLDCLIDFVSSTQDRQFVVEREFAAPRALVFAAWKDADRISRWWGPDGFTTTTEKMEFVNGGEWVYVMHGPDGADYHNRIRYIDILEPLRIAYEHSGTGDHLRVQFESRVTFSEWGGKTLVTLKSVFPTAAMRDDVVTKYGAIEGANMTLARLAELVEA